MYTLNKEIARKVECVLFNCGNGNAKRPLYLHRGL